LGSLFLKRASPLFKNTVFTLKRWFWKFPITGTKRQARYNFSLYKKKGGKLGVNSKRGSKGEGKKKKKKREAKRE
jgi:hypothetical protein